jgi:hypothetical protein
MTEEDRGIVWDGDYGEWQGIITLDVPLAARTPAGREKHVDPEEKGLQLASNVQARLQKFHKDSFDWAIGDVSFVSHRDKRWHDWAEGLAGLEAEMEKRFAPPVRADTPDDDLSYVPHDISAARIINTVNALGRLAETMGELGLEEVSDTERAALARAAFLAEAALDVATISESD